MKGQRIYPRYTVTPKAEAALLRGHPWVYGEEILSAEGTAENGGLVDIVGNGGSIWAQGFCRRRRKSGSGCCPGTPTTALTRPSGGGSFSGPGSTGKL